MKNKKSKKIGGVRVIHYAPDDIYYTCYSTSGTNMVPLDPQEPGRTHLVNLTLKPGQELEIRQEQGAFGETQIAIYIIKTAKGF